MAKQSADFDARNYGFARLSDLADASGILDVERTGDQNKVVTVKLKGG
ncbi:OST-HTH/LOTUS domain-containing protein [Shinella sp. PSBB067]|nr:OST-HTH/LOTUS domain-containing protein [Shinella sp. PSBB067]